MKMSGVSSVRSSRTLNLNSRSKMKTSEKSRKMKPAKQLSNDPNMSCRVFCNICDRLYFLSGLRKHVAHKHSLTYTEYKRCYGGDPRRQLINSVYHPCVICKKVVLLDTDELGKHLKDHGLGYTQYVKENMTKGSGLISSSRPPVAPLQSTRKAYQPSIKTVPLSNIKADPAQNKTQSQVPVSPSGPRTRSMAKIIPLQSPISVGTSALPPSPPLTPPSTPTTTATPLQVKSEPMETTESSYFPVKLEPVVPEVPEVPVEPSVPNLIIIQCEQCSRTFKQNIQLKVHIRRHHS